METRTSPSFQARRMNRSAISISCFLFFLWPWLVGCGAPGDPTPPSPIIPAAIADLSATQAGDGVQLTFTIPGKTTSGERLADPPAVEILRGSAKPDGSPY